MALPRAKIKPGSVGMETRPGRAIEIGYRCMRDALRESATPTAGR